jgi:catechol 2,3-dioxygenase-like lactoylglutathione lyase family enzyme
MEDVGLTHIALPVTDLDTSLRFYSRYAKMEVVHRRKSEESGREVAWVSDKTRPFVIVLVEVNRVDHPLLPLAHLGVAYGSLEEVDAACAAAREEGALHSGPEQDDPPVGYWAFLRDPDGHTLEITFGQEVGTTLRDVTKKKTGTVVNPNH